MSEKLKIYVAGYECFLPNSTELALNAKNLCEKYGFEALSPILENGNKEERDISLTKEETAKYIFKKNIRLIDRCDIIVANLNNFRGWEPDSGTCFEIGCGYAKGKKLYGFIDDMRPCYEKYIGSIHKDGGLWRDDNGAFFESGCVNLMISGPAKIAQGGLERALQMIKNDLEQGE